MLSTPVPLDETDRKILAELSRDAWQSVTAIAAAVHVSRAHARINRLRDEDVTRPGRCHRNVTGRHTDVMIRHGRHLRSRDDADYLCT